MEFLGDNFVYSVVVIKGDKAEPPLLPSGAFLHDVDAFNPAIFLKVLPNVVLLGVLLDATDKDLLHCQVGAWFIGVLSGHCPLGFDNAAIDFMRPCFHGIVDLPYSGVCHKAKPS